MNILISNNRDYPIYNQISEQIKKMVADNILKTGDEILSYRELAKILKVNITAVQKAYENLEKEGIIKIDATGKYFIS